MNMTLYISGKAVDLDTSSLILYNYTRDEASNPTIVKNSYSQKVTIPATPANNAIFSHYYRNDYKTTASGFNPIAKTPFEIRNERNEILESGYVKMESVQHKGADVVNYSISLIGGLGGFFYALKYDSNGNEKTLASMYYNDNGTKELASSIAFPVTASTVHDVWEEIESDGGYGYEEVGGHLINFVPCNNGLPSCKFDAKKAVYRSDIVPMGNIITSKYEDDVLYGPKSGANGNILIEMENARTEWEMQDLRAYLQRPAISLRGLLTTIAFSENTGEYTLALDTDIFNVNTLWYEFGWVTLQMFDRDNITPAGATLADILAGTKSPADYLIGIAKAFGLVFIYDGVTKTITLTSRAKFYNNSTPIDIADKIDTTSISVTPTTIEKRWYIFQNKMAEGMFTEQYETNYGKQYGSAWVDTGYGFNDEQNDIFSNAPFKDAADVQESSVAYMTNYAGPNTPDFDINLKFDLLEELKWELYDADDNHITINSRRAYIPAQVYEYRIDADNNGLMAMPQFHDKENKASDGSGVLLYFDRFVPTRVLWGSRTNAFQYPFYVTNDLPTAFDTLNGGTPCWIVSGVRNQTQADMSENIPYVVTNLPNFRRWHFDGSRVMDESMDFGNVQETQVPDTFVPNKGIYYKRWQKYIEDRCNIDTRVLTCKVDLSGMKVDASLLRRFFAFDGAVWSLNKIVNYSMTKPALTQCEFIKVQNITNYTTQ